MYDAESGRDSSIVDIVADDDTDERLVIGSSMEGAAERIGRSSEFDVVNGVN